MENVFSEMGAQITVGSSIEDSFVKPKRYAFVFITADSDSSLNALEELRKIEEVQEVYVAKGAYDLVARVHGENLDQLREVIGKRIRNLSSIKSTLTLTVV